MKDKLEEMEDVVRKTEEREGGVESKLIGREACKVSV